MTIPAQQVWTWWILQRSSVGWGGQGSTQSWAGATHGLLGEGAVIPEVKHKGRVSLHTWAVLLLWTSSGVFHSLFGSPWKGPMQANKSKSLLAVEKWAVVPCAWHHSSPGSINSAGWSDPWLYRFCEHEHQPRQMNPAQIELFSKRKIPDRDGENVDIVEASACISISRYPVMLWRRTWATCSTLTHFWPPEASSSPSYSMVFQ